MLHEAEVPKTKLSKRKLYHHVCAHKHGLQVAQETSVLTLPTFGEFVSVALSFFLDTLFLYVKETIL